MPYRAFPLAPFIRVAPLHALHHKWAARQSHVGQTGQSYVFWLVTQGRVEVHAARGHWELEEGMAFLFKISGERTVSTATGAEWYSVGLDATIYDTLYPLSLLSLPAVWVPSENFAVLEACCAGIARSWGVPKYIPVDVHSFSAYLLEQRRNPPGNDAARSLLCEGYARALFTYCWQQWSEQSMEEVARNRFPTWMPVVLSRLRETPGIGVEELAHAVGISRRQLGRVFQSTFGASPLAFLNRRRLEEARQLLLNSSLSIPEIAHQTGFADASHFNRSFKVAFHSPPDTYRRQTRNDNVVI